jgi:hypothetical protein
MKEKIFTEMSAITTHSRSYKSFIDLLKEHCNFPNGFYNSELHGSARIVSVTGYYDDWT